jgi:Holliday junction DNA helicase RuvA
VIGSLRGDVLERDMTGSVLVEVGGVGYVVQVTERTLAELEPGSTSFLHVHHHIREDAQVLFGFTSRDERNMFKTLISAHKVGPALAMAMLATHPPAALVDIIGNGDAAALALVPGVGKKTADRLIVELKDKLSLPVLDDPGGGGGGSSPVAHVRDALASLGYGNDEIRAVLRELPSDGDSEQLLRDALKSLGASRA